MRDNCIYRSVSGRPAIRHIFYISVNNSANWMEEERDSWLRFINSKKKATDNEILTHSEQVPNLFIHSLFCLERKTSLKRVLEYITRQCRNVDMVIFILSGHGFGSRGVSSLHLGGKDYISIEKLYCICNECNVSNVMFISDMCRTHTQKSTSPMEWRESSNVIVIEATKRFQSAAGSGLLVQGVMSAMTPNKFAELSMNEMCVDIVVSAAQIIRPHFEDSMKRALDSIRSTVSKVWEDSSASEERIKEESVQRYLGHFLPQAYMTTSQGQRLTPEQITILRHATGVPFSSLESFRTNRVMATLAYS